VPVPCFLLFLCFKKVTQEIFSELDETKAEHLEIYRSFQRTEEETERGHRAARPPGARPAAGPRPPVVTYESTAAGCRVCHSVVHYCNCVLMLGPSLVVFLA
jgi:hypothetical protein